MNDKYVEALDALIKHYRDKVEELEVIKLEYIRKKEEDDKKYETWEGVCE